MDRFRELLEAYGAEPRRWPARERAMAEALLAESPEARALHAKSAGLDALLDRALPLSPPIIDAEALIGRITAEGQGQVVALKPARQASATKFWLKVASLAAAAAIGFLVGASQLANMGESPTPASGPEVAEITPW